MGSLFLFMMTSLDGYYEGPNHDIIWHNVDEEFNEFAIQQLNETDLLLFGRRTYELMAGYWPTPAATTDDPIVAEKMNSLPKIVFSRTLDKPQWDNTRLIKDRIPEEVTRLKQEPGKKIAVLGSSDLSTSLSKQGLIDEYRIMVNPVLLGNGKPLLQGLSEKLKLRLLKTRAFKSGNVLLYYQPERR